MSASTAQSASVAAAASNGVAPDPAPTGPDGRTLWGLSPQQLHDRYWASRGIQVVRRGEATEVAPSAQLYLLAEPDMLTVFRPARVVERLVWTGVDLMFVRIADPRQRPYKEQIEVDDEGRFVGFERIYNDQSRQPRRWTRSKRQRERTPPLRVAVTPDEKLARLWQTAPPDGEAWRQLRKAAGRGERWVMSVPGRVYNAAEPADLALFLRELAKTWRRPDAVVDGLRRAGPEVWADRSAALEGAPEPVGPVWVGAGRRIEPGEVVMGPAVVWDDPEAAPTAQGIQWLQLEPSAPPEDLRPRARGGLNRAAKRAFDIAFATAVIAVTLPLYPLIMLAILLDDGAPFFFVHERETLGGRPFGCIKFRSMRKDAEHMKQSLADQNQADGPQFYIENDPRLTRVGPALRKLHLDELPQFFNVLVGQMSVVGPRPSPRSENQFCPGWREARLSVRPGVTGLWQVKRTRAAGADFQEWIRYDLEYVERSSLLMDLRIIWQTGALLFRSVMRS